ncbi:Hypothetical protein NTJ_03339 [Nesidiocoris tenuis]|uniref:Ionotropic glutamate receptor C-terminal domain-containing protein n=1 Tax=Nesidiocoris tenuis TaxID=355587 RepID=A0ABN7AGN5_9HEMI|nr:Hypothetical protein NTJ_03339 [Nesidiocoris tenuis]
MLLFKVVGNHFNPLSPVFLILGSADDTGTVDQLSTQEGVYVMSLKEVDGLFNRMQAMPSCILIVGDEEWRSNRTEAICRCRVLLAMVDLGLYGNASSSPFCLNTVSLNVESTSSTNDGSTIRLSIPTVRRYSNDSISFHDASYWSPHNTTSLEPLLKKRKTSCLGGELKASIFAKRSSAIFDSDGTYSGIDVEMLKLVTQALNVTLKILEGDRAVKYGSKLPDGSFNGILGDVYSRRTDLAANRLFIKEYGSSEFIFTIPIEQEALCIVAPKPNLVPNWKLVLRAFGPNVWIMIAASIVSFILTWHLCNSRGYRGSELADSVFYIVGMCISVIVLPKKPWQRMLTLTVLMSFGVLSPAFTGSLLSLLKKRSYEKQIKTLAQVKESSYDIYTYSSNLIEDSVPDQLKGRLRLFKSTDNGEDLIEIVGTYKNLTYLGKECEIHRRIKETRSEVKIVRECTRVYHLAYLMRRNSFLYRSVNIAMARIVAAGLNLSPYCSLECTRISNEDPFMPTPLKISDLAIALNVIKLGLSTSIEPASLVPRPVGPDSADSGRIRREAAAGRRCGGGPPRALGGARAFQEKADQPAEPSQPSKAADTGATPLASERRRVDISAAQPPPHSRCASRPCAPFRALSRAPHSLTSRGSAGPLSSTRCAAVSMSSVVST